MQIVFLIVGLIIGLFFMYFVLRPKLKTTKEFDYKTEEQNKILQQDKISYQEEIKKLQNTILLYNDYLTQQKLDLCALKTKQDEIKTHTEEIRKQLDKDNEVIYQTSYNLMQEKLDSAAQQESQKYQQAKEEAKANYLSFLEELAEETAAAITSKLEEIHQVEESLANMRAKADAAIAAAKREEEMKRNPQDYCIYLEKADKVDITRMLEFSETLNNPRALLMCIWTTFIRTPLRTLCNNVFGNNEVCGIYKLTINNQIYIGQSVHCKERMSEHFKKALGIDAPVTSKLYNYLKRHNIWDIQIELLERCKPEELNDREKFFIELLSADKSLNSNTGNRG